MNAHTHVSWALFGRFARQALLSVCIGSLLIVSAGCIDSPVPQTPISFEGLCGFTQEQFASMDETALIQWVQGEYDVTPWTSGPSNERGSLATLYEWNKDGLPGSAWLRDGQLAWVLRERKEALSLALIVDVLGPPETVYRYVTRQENTVYVIRLEYPTKGFSVEVDGLRYGYVSHETLSGSMQVSTVLCYTAGPLETVLEKAFGVAPENMSYQMSKRMPWPGFGASIPLDPTP